MKGLTGYSKRSGFHPMGNHGSFRDLRQNEDPKFVKISYSKDPEFQNFQIPVSASSSQERNAGGLLWASLLIIRLSPQGPGWSVYQTGETSEGWVDPFCFGSRQPSGLHQKQTEYPLWIFLRDQLLNLDPPDSKFYVANTVDPEENTCTTPPKKNKIHHLKEKEERSVNQDSFP